jgi:hypothetical protein
VIACSWLVYIAEDSDMFAAPFMASIERLREAEGYGWSGDMNSRFICSMFQSGSWLGGAQWTRAKWLLVRICVSLAVLLSYFFRLPLGFLDKIRRFLPFVQVVAQQAEQAEAEAERQAAFAEAIAKVKEQLQQDEDKEQNNVRQKNRHPVYDRLKKMCSDAKSRSKQDHFINRDMKCNVR